MEKKKNDVLSSLDQICHETRRHISEIEKAYVQIQETVFLQERKIRSLQKRVRAFSDKEPVVHWLVEHVVDLEKKITNNKIGADEMSFLNLKCQACHGRGWIVDYYAWDWKMACPMCNKKDAAEQD